MVDMPVADHDMRDALICAQGVDDVPDEGSIWEDRGKPEGLGP
jgi:hypothetical protein